jgi:hypothetical protein
MNVSRRPHIASGRWEAFVGLAAGLAFASLQMAACSFKASHAADQASFDYVSKAIPAIFTSWSVDQLQSRGSNDYLRRASRQQTQSFLKDMALRYGPMKSFRDLKGTTSIVNDAAGNLQEITVYSAQVEFSKRSAVLTLQLSKSGDDWRIEGFHLEENVGSSTG